MSNYSLADHTISIQTENMNLVIGNGSATESITITWDNDNFSYTTSPDGQATLNVNYMFSGSFTISLQQTNPFVDQLLTLFKHQIQGGIVDTGNAKIKDINGNINGEFQGCVISKIPDYSAEAENGTRDFVVLFKKGMIN